MNNIPEADLIYVAGFVDGEAWIGCHRKDEMTFGAVMNVANTNIEIIEYLHKLFGVGSIQYVTNRKSKNKDYAYWCVTGKNCRDILLQLKPYLKIKKLQAELCISLAESINQGCIHTPPEEIKRRFTIYLYLQKLNKRGKPITEVK